MSDTNNAPRTVELADIPDRAKQALTQEEMNEVEQARQKAMLRASTQERLDILSSEISVPTRTKLEQNGAKLSELAEEKWLLDKAQDYAESAWQTAKNGLDNIGSPIDAGKQLLENAGNALEKAAGAVGLTGVATAVSSTRASIESTEQKLSTFDKFKSDPIGFLKEMFSAVVAWFKSGFKDTSAFESLFGSSEFSANIKRAINFVDDKIIDLSDAMMAEWEDLFEDVKWFKDLTIEDLRKSSSEADIAQKLGIKADNEILKRFLQVFFEKENFAKMAANVQQKTGEKLDESKTKIGDFFQKLA